MMRHDPTFADMTTYALDHHRLHTAIASIATSEGPATAWLRSNAEAIAQIKRDRLADEARTNGGQSNG